MKVKVTATVTREMELDPEDYTEVENGPKTDAEIIAWELQQARNEPFDSYVMDYLSFNGELSDIKIEKLEETAAPAASEAA